MRVLLLKPPFARLLSSDVYLTYPIGLMYVAAMLRERGHEALIWHDDVSNKAPIPRAGVTIGQMNFGSIDYATYEPLQKCLDEFAPDVVGISYCTVDAEAAHATAAEVRKRGIRLVAGGIHPSLLPVGELDWFDCVVVGEGDHPNTAVVFETDCVGVFTAPRCEDLDRVRPARDAVLNGSRYSPYLRGMIQTQRGCPYNCGYCAAPKVFGTRVRLRDPGLVREEVESLGVTQGRIIDDSFAVRKQHGLAICNELAKTGYRWVCDMALQNVDEEIIAAMAAAGCMQVNIGIESATPRWRELSGKIVAEGQPENVLNLCRRYGIGVVYYLMLGFVGETFEELKATLAYARYLKELGAHPCMSVVTPYPQTKIWSMLYPGIREQLQNGSWSEFLHQSSGMGFAHCTQDEWMWVLEEANRLDG